MIDFTVEVQGMGRVLARLAEIQRRTGDLRPVYRRVVDPEVSRFLRLQFETAGRYGGDPWAPLRQSTIRHRTRAGGNRGGTNRPLWDTGRLRASLVKVGPESIRSIGRTRYVRGTSVPYAAHHQEGATLRSWGGNPFHRARRLRRRSIFPRSMPPRFTSRLLRGMEDYVTEGEA